MLDMQHNYIYDNKSYKSSLSFDSVGAIGLALLQK